MTLNNMVFSYAIIADMDKDIELGSEQSKRLFMAAKELRGIDVSKRGGRSELAKLLDVLPQQITNWAGGRPISSEALLEAQKVLGCDAIWLRDGVGDMVRGGAEQAIDMADVAELIVLFGRSTHAGKAQILDSAHAAPKLSSAKRNRTTNN